MQSRHLAAVFCGCLTLGLNAQILITSLEAVGPAGSGGYGISPTGVVVGAMQVPGGAAHAFRYSGGVLTDLGTGGTGTVAVAINATGTVVINAGGGISRTVYYASDGAWQSIGSLGGNASQGAAINAVGDIVGYAENEFGQGRAFLFRDAEMRDLGTLGGSTAQATAINDSGQIVGQARDASARNRAFLYSDGAMRDLGTLGGAQAAALAINSAGQVVGYAKDADGNDRAFLYSDGVMSDLGTLGGMFGYALAINASGLVVGYSENALGQERAFIHADGTMYDLELQAATFLSDGVTGTGFVSINAASSFAINDAGQIVGTGQYFDGTGIYERAFLMTVSAVPEPSAYACFAGAAALGLAGWRRRMRR